MNASNRHHLNPARLSHYRRSMSFDDWAHREEAKAERVLTALDQQACELLEELRGELDCLIAHVKNGDTTPEQLDWQVARQVWTTMGKWMERLEQGRERETTI